jgi:glycogen(starch) synthase
MKDFFENRHGHQRVINIPNGVLDALFALKPEEKGFILFLGRIDMYMKGLDILIEAFSRVHDRDVSLKTAGSGKKAYLKRLGRVVLDYGLENRVEYLGRVKAEDKRELLRTWLFVVMPSRFEGWGITEAEANAT